jgi:hypothetical protein
MKTYPECRRSTFIDPGANNANSIVAVSRDASSLDIHGSNKRKSKVVGRRRGCVLQGNRTRLRGLPTRDLLAHPVVSADSVADTVIVEHPLLRGAFLGSQADLLQLALAVASPFIF